MTKGPQLIAPPGACDCHMHVFEDHFAAPDDARPRPPQASVAMYREVQAALGLQRVVVVQSNFYGSDKVVLEDMHMAVAGAGRRDQLWSIGHGRRRSGFIPRDARSPGGAPGRR